MSRLRCAHSSGQFSDTVPQQREDAIRLTGQMIHRNWWWLTGTEAGKESDLADAFRGLDDKNGLKFRKGHNGDVWILHRKDLFPRGVFSEFHKVINGVAGEFADRGVMRVTGYCPSVQANLTVLAAHYVTEGNPGHHTGTRLEWNQKIADKVGDLARHYGRGRNLVFYGGDQNSPDRKYDTFMGNPLTSLADELHQYENTGHGAIDVIASYDLDKRVTGVAYDAFPDHEFPLNTDHYLIEGEFRVADLKPKTGTKPPR